MISSLDLLSFSRCWLFFTLHAWLLLLQIVHCWPKKCSFLCFEKSSRGATFHIDFFKHHLLTLRVVYCLETSLNLWLLDIDKGWVLNLGSIQQNDDPKSFFRGPGGPCPFGQTFYFNTNNFRKGTVKAQNFLPIYFSGPGPRPCVSTGSSMEISK